MRTSKGTIFWAKDWMIGAKDWMIDRRQEDGRRWRNVRSGSAWPHLRAPEGRLLILLIISVLLLSVILIILHRHRRWQQVGPAPRPAPTAVKHHIYTEQVASNILLFAAWRPSIRLKAVSVSACKSRTILSSLSGGGGAADVATTKHLSTDLFVSIKSFISQVSVYNSGNNDIKIARQDCSSDTDHDGVGTQEFL